MSTIDFTKKLHRQLWTPVTVLWFVSPYLWIFVNLYLYSMTVRGKLLKKKSLPQNRHLQHEQSLLSERFDGYLPFAVQTKYLPSPLINRVIILCRTKFGIGLWHFRAEWSTYALKLDCQHISNTMLTYTV